MNLHYIKKIKGFFNHKAIALMYHRIANIATDPWQLAVSPINFEEQLQVLKQYFTVISVRSLSEQIKQKAFTKNCICLTFDDGYYDNFYYAKPLLEKYNCPATFFVPTYYIDSNKQFWWDELENIVFNSEKLPLKLQLNLHNKLFNFQLESEYQTEIEIKKQKSWVWTQTPPTNRCKLYLALHHYLKPQPHPDICNTLSNIKSWAGYEPNFDKFSCPMTSFELKQMIKQPLFDIGMHTVTHPTLAFQSDAAQRAEIVGSREYLQTKFERYIDAIAYPYGSFNQSTLSIMQEQKVSTGFTTSSHVITKNSNAHLLGRYQIENWNGDEFEKQLYSWSNSYK